MKKVLVSVIGVALVLSMTGCNLFKSEKSRFIDAISETTCMFVDPASIQDPELETKVKAVFEKYGFEVEDETAMNELNVKYQDDEEVKSAVLEALAECSGETPAEEVPAEETPAEETPAEETPAEETPAEEVPAEETPAE